MPTVTIQIGNSDDKLTQSEWADFVEEFAEMIGCYVDKMHFFGAPPNYSFWQNVCWVVETDVSSASKLKYELGELKKRYKQDSVAWTEGETSFI